MYEQPAKSAVCHDSPTVPDVSINTESAIGKEPDSTPGAVTNIRSSIDQAAVVCHHGEIVGNSAALWATLKRAEAVAATSVTALITGESGVGKELIARVIHRLSPRRDCPFIKVNCASVPSELFESEFFGHTKGSFTGAHRDRVGRFELAHGATLFLDEVAEIPLNLQAKLLRVLQEGQFERVGDAQTRTVDVRVVAATNQDLQQAVADGTFRDDLYYRLGVFPIHVPPLRDRRADIEPLVLHFLGKICQQFERQLMAPDTDQLALLTEHDWPGNVRELKNLIQRAVILAKDGRLSIAEAMSAGFIGSTVAYTAPRADPSGFVKEADWRRSYRENIIAALEAAHWRVSGGGGAADLLGINASTLRGRMKSLGIPTPRDPH